MRLVLIACLVLAVTGCVDFTAADANRSTRAPGAGERRRRVALGSLSEFADRRSLRANRRSSKWPPGGPPAAADECRPAARKRMIRSCGTAALSGFNPCPDCGVRSVRCGPSPASAEQRDGRKGQRRAGQNRDHGDPGDVPPRRQPSELLVDDFELVVDRVEIGAGRVGLAQGEAVRTIPRAWVCRDAAAYRTIWNGIDAERGSSWKRLQCRRNRVPHSIDRDFPGIDLPL